jgi:hypothetical protein
MAKNILKCVRVIRALSVIGGYITHLNIVILNINVVIVKNLAHFLEHMRLPI